MAPSIQTEIERKYDVSADTVVPGDELVGIAHRIEKEKPVEMTAVYLDTAARALGRARITLRKRIGGHDEGWHVKLPGSEGRTELHAPLTRGSAVPKDLRRSLLVHLRGSRLERIARLETTRTIVRLLDDAGRTVVELSDDLVVATDLRRRRVRSWREWEAELGDGAPGSAEQRARLLDRVEEILHDAGAHPAATASKLQRATAPDDDDVDDTTDGPTDARAEVATAGDVAVTAIHSLVSSIVAIDAFVRVDAPDSVHRMRVLTRRLRSVLAATSAVFDDDGATTPLRSELKWLAGLLGRARDAEVAGARIEELFDDGGADSPAIVVDLVARDRLLAASASRYRAAHQTLVGALESKRYLALIDALDAFVALPPVTDDAGRSAESFVASTLKRERKRARKVRDRAVEAASGGGASADTIEARHDLRKAAKRLRYVAEALAIAAPDAARSSVRRSGARAEAVADALGEERDAHTMQMLLLDASEEAHRARERTFSYGYAAAEERRRELESSRLAHDAIRSL